MNKNGNFELKPPHCCFLMDSTGQITETGLPIPSICEEAVLTGDKQLHSFLTEVMRDPLLQGRVTTLLLCRGCTSNCAFSWLADVAVGQTAAPLPITAEGCALVRWLYSQIWFTAQHHKPLSQYNCQGEGLQEEQSE